MLNHISIAGGLDNPLVEVEYRGRQSNVILTTQGTQNIENIWINKNTLLLSTQPILKVDGGLSSTEQEA